MKIELALIVTSSLCLTIASPYDPHLPRGSPWFEGWYTRIIERSSALSIGAIVGYYPESSGLRDPAAYVALIVDSGHGQVQTFQAYPVAVTVQAAGNPVVRDPDLTSPPNFTFSAENNLVRLHQQGDVQTLEMEFTAEGVRFEAALAAPQAWDKNGDGPEGWAGRLPFLGLHWFVYSLNSSASFTLTGPTFGTVNATGHAHQEKNWGKEFPTSWIWGEAMNSCEGVRLALAGGPTPAAPIVSDAFLVGYRSSKLDWSFHPQDPALFHPKMDACSGTFELHAASATRLLRIVMQMDPDHNRGLFTVAGPRRFGFEADSVESYRTNVTVEAYSGFLHNKLEERIDFSVGALEFGGKARCSKERHSSALSLARLRRQMAVVPETLLPDQFV